MFVKEEEPGYRGKDIEPTKVRLGGVGRMRGVVGGGGDRGWE